MFLETSQDILFITVSLCTLVFTGFLCAVLFHLTRLLKQSNQITEELHGKLSEWVAAIDEIKERVMNTAASLSSLGEQVGRVIDFIQSRRERDRDQEEFEEEDLTTRKGRRKTR